MRLFLGICLTSLCCLATAADTAKVSAARRLVDLLQVEETYRDIEKLCRDSHDVAAEARASFDAAPDSFGGITPDSAYWGEVQTMFKTYRQDMCGSLDMEAAKNIYIQVFANRLSVAELETSIAAMSTPVGRATQTASREAGHLLMAYMLERQQGDADKANQRFQRSLEELKARHKAAPR